MTMKQYLTVIVTGLASIASVILEAGKNYVKALEQHPGKWRQYFIENSKYGKQDGDILELIGYGKLMPQFFMTDRKVSVYAATLPMKVQEGCINNGIEVAYRDGTVVNMSIYEVTSKDFAIAVGPKGPRSVEKQLQLLRDASQRVVETRARWEIINNNTVKFNHKIYTLQELREILAIVEKKMEEKGNV